MRKVLVLILLLAAPATASAHPCDVPPIMRAPSAELLAPLGVLRSIPGPDDLAPAEVREDETRPYVTSIRWAPTPRIGGGAWVVPQYDVSDRVPPVSRACMRTIPKRYRPRIRELVRLSTGIRREEGLQLLPYAADGESLGNVNGSVDDVLSGQFVHVGEGPNGRTRVVGLVPDGVARVQVILRDYRRNARNVGEAAGIPVGDNVFGVDVAVPWDPAGATIEPEVTMLDASGAVVPPKR